MHLFLVAMHLFLVANLVTTSKALVTTSDALGPSSFLLLEGKAWRRLVPSLRMLEKGWSNAVL